MSNLCGLCMKIDSYHVALLNAVILTPSRLDRNILRLKFEFLTANPKIFSEKIEASEFENPINMTLMTAAGCAVVLRTIKFTAPYPR